VVTPLDGDGVKATAALEQAGPLGSLMGRLTKRLTNEYLETEVRALKARFEG
jgi:hypothetical protein